MKTLNREGPSRGSREEIWAVWGWLRSFDCRLFVNDTHVCLLNLKVICLDDYTILRLHPPLFYDPKLPLRHKKRKEGEIFAPGLLSWTLSPPPPPPPIVPVGRRCNRPGTTTEGKYITETMYFLCNLLHHLWCLLLVSTIFQVLPVSHLFLHL